MDSGFPNRKRPADGLYYDSHKRLILFVTVCTKNRNPWLASDENLQLLRDTWKDSNAWLVGKYMIMPDHLHLFASPNNMQIQLKEWVRYWKSCFTKKIHNSEYIWQSNCWDTRLRNWEHYDSKWIYVRENPVRKGLVDSSGLWPYQGIIYDLSID